MKSKKYILMVAGTALLVLLGTAGSNTGKGQQKLGGAWIGSGGQQVWTSFQTPLDSAGMTAALRVNYVAWDSGSAALISLLGGDTMTEFSGSQEMISRDTAKSWMIGYFTKAGNPPLICAIAVFKGTTTYVGPNDIVVEGDLDFYPGPANALGLSNADANGDGFPDPRTAPWLSVHFGPVTAKRAVSP